MPDLYRLVYHDAFRRRMKAISRRALEDPDGPDAAVRTAALEALNVLREGREREFGGEQLGFSASHFDLRDCGEIKFPVFQEFTRSGKPMGPSHRMIYREYQPAAAEPRPVREVIAFEHRAGGRPFNITAAAFNRRKALAVGAL